MTDQQPAVEMQSKTPKKSVFSDIDSAMIFDNPIIIRQTRVRLRRSSIVTWLMFVGLISCSLLWMEFQFGRQRYDRSAGYIMGGMVFMMLIVGTQQVGLMLNAVRATGMIDFHRLSPQSPLSLYIGFLLGGPIREYLITAFAGLFLLLACVLYGTPIFGVSLILLAFLMLCFNLYGLSIVSVMLARNPNPNAAKGAAWGVFAAMGALGPLFSGMMVLDRMATQPTQVTFFGYNFNVFVLFSLVTLVSFGYLLTAGVRRFRDDNCPSLNKKQALSAYACAILFGIGIAYHNSFMDENLVQTFEVMIIGFWVIVSFILLATASPERVVYIGGLRRSLRLGLRRPGPFQDRALNRWTLGGFAILLTIGISSLSFVRNEVAVAAESLPSVSTATAILVMLQYGLGLQYFRLRLGKNSGGALFGFYVLAWVLPFLLGISVTVAGSGPELEDAGLIIMCISPVPGVVIGSGIIPDLGSAQSSAQLAALLPTLISVFLFNTMIVNLQRRIDRRILPDHKAENADPFAYLEHVSARDLVGNSSRKKTAK